VIDRAQRHLLAEALRLLIEGTVSESEWIRLEPMLNKGDGAIRAVWEFGYGLNTDSVFRTFHPNWPCPSLVREVNQRCVTFLRCPLEYEWPPFPEDKRLSVLWFLILILTGTVIGTQSKEFAFGLGLFGLGLLLTIVFRCLEKRRDRIIGAHFWSVGEKEVWPFFRRADYFHWSEILRSRGGGSADPGSVHSSA
jgi:hypothetical protein